MRRRFVRAAAIAAVIGGGVFLVVASGVVPIKASSGHWPITEWFLHFAMTRSVALHSVGIATPPDLDDPAMVLRGAGHYEGGCRPCHGGPEARQPEIPGKMTPQPPFLPLRIDQWEPRELFYIVKHGVKFTGMPPWVTQQRDDEVWAVVAFLLRFPELDEEEYERLVHWEEEPVLEPELEFAVAHDPAEEALSRPPRRVLDTCARCHGSRGQGRGLGAFPILAGQREEYLFDALRAYAVGTRQSGIMAPLAAALEEEEMRELAEYYARLPKPSPEKPGRAAEAIRRGGAIATEGIPGENVPACVDCHGPATSSRSRHYPRLDGQYARYLELQLELFHDDRRGGGPWAHLMQEVAPYLDAEQRRDVAAWFAAGAAGDAAGSSPVPEPAGLE